MKRISWRDIGRQIKADLIGKDSHRGVTLTYSWLANQFGHFSLGFIPTSLLYAALTRFTSLNVASLRVALIISVFWFVFELYNFLAPLLSKKRTRYGLFWIAGSEYRFKPKFWNIGFDTLTDLFFFWMGACAAALVIKFSVLLICIFGTLLVISMACGLYWYLTKMYLQYAHYPAQLRLSQYDGYISETDKKIVEGFLKDGKGGLHLFVFGPAGSGKTPLSIGMATELSIRHRACLYLTTMKLFSMFCDAGNKPPDKKYFWSWRSASVLVIDDINPGDPIEDLITPDKFLSMIDTTPNGRETMADKKIIWVLGNQNSDHAYVENWKGMLMTMGVDEGKIMSVNLQKDIALLPMAEYGSHRRN